MNYAEEFIAEMTFDEFLNDKKTVLSVTKCIEVVGEATKHIPDPIREKYPRFPGATWQESEIGLSMATSRSICQSSGQL